MSVLFFKSDGASFESENLGLEDGNAEEPPAEFGEFGDEFPCKRRVGR